MPNLTPPDFVWTGVDWSGTDFDDLEPCDLRAVPAPVTPLAPKRPTLRPVATLRPGTPSRRVRTRRPTTPKPTTTKPDGTISSVLLIDLENVCSGSRRPSKVLKQLRLLLAAAGDVDEVLAVASTRVLQRQGDLLARAGIPTRSVRSGPDAADRMIVLAAREYAARGATTFHVASADHFFVKVASLGTLNVITVPGRKVSARLASAAASVSVAA